MENGGRLQGQVAFVTGSSRGIGRAIANKLALEGAKVALCSRNMEGDPLSDIKAYGHECRAYRCDVSRQEDVRRTIEQIDKDLGCVSILVNAAGISPKAEAGMKQLFYNLQYDTWKEVLDINLDSAFLCSSAVVPDMMAKKYGRIINISSIVGLTSSEHGPANAAYVASKTGLIGLTRAMAYDLAPYGITVNAVAPGRIQTEMSRSNNKCYDELHKKLICMHRFGTTDDVANAVLYYALPSSGYVTGDTMNITGGWFL